MNCKPPKNTEKYFWTQHAIYKLRQYGLSAQRVIRVINNPQRKEEGIVAKTVAVMQPASVRTVRTSAGKPVKKWSQEIWAMYQSAGGGQAKSAKFQPMADPSGAEKVQSELVNLISKKQIKIISAWRYPGVSPKKDPIPREILEELENLE